MADPVDDFHLLHPGDRLVGDVGGEVIVRIVRPRNAIAVLVEDSLVLARVPGIEAVEVVEAEAIGPSVEGSDLTGFPDRRVAVFAIETKAYRLGGAAFSATVPVLCGMMPV